MNFLVCIKQVPGTTQVKIDPKTNTLVREGVESIINPFDAYAIEEGVRLKERASGTCTVLTMGPPQAEQALRDAVSVGADNAILISDRAFAGSDTWATAQVLATAVSKVKDFDLVICGRQSIDGDTGQVAPEMAEKLCLPFVSYVSKVEEIKPGYIRVQRLVEDGHEVVECPLPAVISVTKEINTPRLPSLRGMMKAKSLKPTVWTNQDLQVPADKVGVAGSATRVVKIFFPQRTRKSAMITGTPEEQVDKLVAKLKETKLI
ncbi:MAG: electron transfer flavoprotein subunit beta/FixA family protein [Chloroflexota bacterium]